VWVTSCKLRKRFKAVLCFNFYELGHYGSNFILGEYPQPCVTHTHTHTWVVSFLYQSSINIDRGGNSSTCNVIIWSVSGRELYRRNRKRNRWVKITWSTNPLRVKCPNVSQVTFANSAAVTWLLYYTHNHCLKN
jgi:hypothetical protein